MLVVAALPRLADLGHPSFSYDEHYDVADSLSFCRTGRASEPISDGYLNGQLPFFAACPLFRVLGPDERTARLLSVLAGLATVGLTWLLASRVLGRRWAPLAAMLVAVSPFAVSSSRLAFSHGHVFHVPLVLLGLYAAACVRGGALAWGALAGLALGLAAGSDLLAVFWAPVTLTVLAHRLRRTPGRPQAAVACGFVVAGLVGLLAASPMYAAHPLTAGRDVAARMGFWDGVTDYFWLGQPQTALPPWYYALIVLVKLGPLSLPPLAVALAAAIRRSERRARLLALALWPVAYFSLKPWKSPFYLAAFVPVLYLLATDGLRRLLRPLRARPALAALVLGAVLAAEAGRAAVMHPDYLMLGIDYSEWLYGDFQGPAVSHGQWVGEALALVRKDSPAANDPNVLVFGGFASEQVMAYARRYGLRSVFDGSQLHERGIAHGQVDYLLVNQDCLRHSEEQRINKVLLRLAADPLAFRVIATFRSGPFPMLWVYRRVTPRLGTG